MDKMRVILFVCLHLRPMYIYLTLPSSSLWCLVPYYSLAGILSSITRRKVRCRPKELLGGSFPNAIHPSV